LVGSSPSGLSEPHQLFVPVGRHPADYILALAGVLGAGFVLWISRSPSWYVIAGFALDWLIDALATVFLHRAFGRAG
jgi:hypothetical protein